MSIENAKAFLKKAESDQELRAKYAAAEDDAGAVVKLAAEAGFTFSEDDLQAAVDELFGELSDDDLEDAAGGLGGIRQEVPDSF